MNQEESSFEITFKEMYRMFTSNLLFIVLVSLVLGTIAFAYTNFLVEPLYDSEAIMIVNNRREDTENVTSDELNTAKNLAGVYSIIIKSDTVLDQVIKNLRLDTTAKALAKTITVQTVDGTQVLNIKTTTNNPEKSQAITSEILKVAPSFIIDTVEAGSVKIISSAKLNEKPVSPNIVVNTILGVLLGMIFSMITILFVYMSDRTFKSDEEITKMFDIPVIGIIPNVDSVRRIK